MAEAGVIGVTDLPDREAASAAVDAGTIQTAVVIPEGFSAAAASGGRGSVEIISDPDATISAQLARSVLSGFTSRVEAVGLAVATAMLEAGQLPTADTSAELAALAQAQPEPIVIVDDAAADREAGVSTYYAAAMAILFVFLGAQFGVTSLLTEKRTKTLSRMLAAPLRPSSIVLGKTVVSMVIAIVSMGIIIIGTSLLLGARWGDPLAVAVLVVAAAVAATGIALLAVGFARSEDQAGSLVAIVTISLAVLGGSFFPVTQGPDFMAGLSRLTPHQWFLDGVDDIASGGDIGSAAGAIAVLVAIGVVTGAVGLWRARKVVIA